MKKIHIPANVESIKLQAFYGCISLISIDIPASVKTIQAGAFSNCRKLASVTFEKGSQLKTIGEIIPSNITKGAFTNCTSLTFIEIPHIVFITIEQPKLIRNIRV